jgi:hypothetical protein
LWRGQADRSGMAVRTPAAKGHLHDRNIDRWHGEIHPQSQRTPYFSWTPTGAVAARAPDCLVFVRDWSIDR